MIALYPLVVGHISIKNLSKQPTISLYEKYASGRSNNANILFSITSQKAQLRSPFSPLRTALTGFNSDLYSCGSSSAGPALVEIATAHEVFYTCSLGGVEALHTILAPGVWQTLCQSQCPS